MELHSGYSPFPLFLKVIDTRGVTPPVSYLESISSEPIDSKQVRGSGADGGRGCGYV